MLRRWTSKDRSDEVTVFLLQSLLTVPDDQALETLRDLKQPRLYLKYQWPILTSPPYFLPNHQHECLLF